MIAFVNLQAVQAYKERRKFLARYWTPERVGLLCFTAGLVVMFLIVSAVHLFTR
jgi:hypothetical protein